MEKQKKERIWLKDTDWAKEWHPEKNHPVQLETLYHQSSYRAWWKCSICHHEWQAKVAHRTEGRSCPKCRVTQQSLQTQAPELARQWDWEKNKPLTPQELFVKSSKKVWWRCEKGHSFERSAAQRMVRNECPICRKINHLKANALMTHYPDIAREWHPTRNHPLSVEEVTVGSQKKVWWQCSKGHEWQAVVGNRVHRLGCPTCQQEERLKTRSLGVLNPALAKEWHPTKNGTLTPFEVLAKSGQKVWWQCEKGHEWETTILSRSNGSGCLRCYRSLASQERSLQQMAPEIACQWHPTKNAPLTPDQISYRSSRLVWWRGTCGHEWEASVNSRHTSKGCPSCRNDQKRLSLIHPTYVNYFDSQRNHPLRYDELSTTFSKPVWWRCEKGHSRRIRVQSFLQRPECPTCRRLSVESIKGSLAERDPQLAKSWHPSKNGDLTPNRVKWKTGKVVWWRCEAGHEWQTSVANRSNGTGCPHCRRNSQTLKGQKNVEKRQLEAEWHPTKNGSCCLEKIFPSGKQHVWWKCQQPMCQHEWEASVVHRLKGHGCPECQIKADSVATRYPQLVDSWCSDKNAPLSIERFYFKNAHSVWWQCEKGHRYRMSVASRLKQVGCPKCRNQITGNNERFFEKSKHLG